MLAAAPSSRIHGRSGSLSRRPSAPRLLAPIQQPLQGAGAPPPPREWSVAEAKALEVQIAGTKTRMSAAQEGRLRSAIQAMKNVPCRGAFNAWFNWTIDTQFAAAKGFGSAEDLAVHLSTGQDDAAGRKSALRRELRVARGFVRSAASRVGDVPLPHPGPGPEPEPGLEPESEPGPDPDVDDAAADVGVPGDAESTGDDAAAQMQAALVSSVLTGTDDAELVAAVLTAGAKPRWDGVGAEGGGMLRAAARRGDSAEVGELILAGVDLNEEDPSEPASSRTAIQQAAKEAHVAVVQQLIDAGAQISSTQYDAAKVNYGAYRLREAREAMAELDGREAAGEVELRGAEESLAELEASRAECAKEKAKIMKDQVQRVRMKGRVVWLDQQLHQYDNVVSGLLVRGRERLAEAEQALALARCGGRGVLFGGRFG
jgi:hypothetical protein